MKSILLLFSLICFRLYAQTDLDCSKIQINIDKFSGDTIFTSPHKQGFIDLVYFEKIGGNIYMSLKGYGSSLSVDQRGVVILLANGVKIEKPLEKINVEANTTTSGWNYSAFIKLDKSDIEKMILSPITDFKLYVYESNLVDRKSKLYWEYLKCMAR
jgi:hypothetical protein